jgi:hypothetical protein
MIIDMRHVIAEVKQRWSVIGWETKNLLYRDLRAPKDTLSRPGCICGR